MRDQRDHFHILHRSRRGARYRAAQALQRAEQAQAAFDRDGRAGVTRSAMRGRLLNQAWAKAEQAFDRWTAQEAADRRRQAALEWITPEGTLDTRARAATEVHAAWAGQTGADWQRARRLVTPEAYTSLDRVQEQFAAPPVTAELRQAAVYGRLGLVLPQDGWWALRKRTPEQLDEQLSALNPAA